MIYNTFKNEFKYFSKIKMVKNINIISIQIII